MKKLLVLGVTVATIALAGCGTASSVSTDANRDTAAALSREAAIENNLRRSADYWERTDAVSAQYLVGPKAQHQLNIDIATCVAEVRELLRLGSIKAAKPPENIAMDQNMRAGWDSATRDGPLYTEYTNFQDFEGCMNAKGWSRSDFVRPYVAARAAHNYNDTILNTTADAALRRSGTTVRNDTYTEYDKGDFNN